MYATTAADARVVGQRLHPVDAAAGVAVGVEERDVDALGRVGADIELGDLHLLLERAEHALDAAHDDFEVVHDGYSERMRHVFGCYSATRDSGVDQRRPPSRDP